MELEVTLFDKDGFIFSRPKKNHYSLTFTIENNNILLPKIIDFNLIKLIYDLNPDVYEKVDVEKINENNSFRFFLATVFHPSFSTFNLLI